MKRRKFGDCCSSLSVAQRPSQTLVYLRDGSAQTHGRAATLRVLTYFDTRPTSPSADQTFYLIQSQYTDTRPTSPSTDQTFYLIQSQYIDTRPTNPRADQTFYLIQSQYTDTGPTNPRADQTFYLIQSQYTDTGPTNPRADQTVYLIQSQYIDTRPTNPSADQTFYFIQSQYTDTRPTNLMADPIKPGAWQGSHWSTYYQVTVMTGPGKRSMAKAGIEPRSAAVEEDALPQGQRSSKHSVKAGCREDFCSDALPDEKRSSLRLKWLSS